MAKFAANRTELYMKLSSKLDLPDLTPAVSLEYLKFLLKLNSPVFKITREETRTLPI